MPASNHDEQRDAVVIPLRRRTRTTSPVVQQTTRMLLAGRTYRPIRRITTQDAFALSGFAQTRRGSARAQDDR